MITGSGLYVYTAFLYICNDNVYDIGNLNSPQGNNVDVRYLHLACDGTGSLGCEMVDHCHQGVLWWGRVRCGGGRSSGCGETVSQGCVMVKQNR